MLETLLEAILWRNFQLVLRILNYVSSITKAPSLHWWFHSFEQVKISCSQVRRVRGMLQCCHIFICYEILDQNRPVCWSIVVKKNQNLVLHSTWRFLLTAPQSRRKVLIYNLFLHSSCSCKLYQRGPGTFWSCYVIHTYSLLLHSHLTAHNSYHFIFHSLSHSLS